MKPYFQDERITIYHGDALTILPQLPRDSVDAIITDPPYSSGGFTRSDKNADPSEKYVQHGTAIVRPSFSGDNRDQRSWTAWATLWLSEALCIAKEGAYCLTFSDWRMLPSATDAFQGAGFVWRGLIAWDKTEGSRAPHCGYFRHQCEYIVWGTRGQTIIAEHGGPWPGCFRCSVKQNDKHHMTGKPTELMNRLVECVAPGGLILDPFAGSGTTLLAASQRGRQAIGIEKEEAYCEIAAKRCQQGEFGLTA